MICSILFSLILIHLFIFMMKAFWFVPLHSVQNYMIKQPDQVCICPGSHVQVDCQCFVPATNRHASATKCQGLINPLGGPGAKMNRVPYETPEGLEYWAAAHFAQLVTHPCK